MPWFLKLLSVVGTVAMLWVGGGILVHGLAVLGLHAPEHAVEWVGGAVAGLLPGEGAARWIGSALANGLVGLGVGFALEPLVAKALAPGWARLAALWR
jgi:predicted DNA repair protein MutK